MQDTETKLRLKTELSIEDGSGDDVSPRPHEQDETVLAAAQDGHSLTLIEEYSMRKQRPTAPEFAFSLLCAAASLAFAALSYINTH